jgi:hypothetical protein
VRSLFLFIYIMQCINPVKAQLGFQVAANSTSIYNTNRQSNVFRFTPILGFDAHIMYKAKLIDRTFCKALIGYTQKGAQQVEIAIAPQAYYRLEYINAILSLQYALKPNSSIDIGIAPGYMMSFKKKENGLSLNNIYSINRRNRNDVAICIGYTYLLSKKYEIGFRYFNSTAPFMKINNPALNKFDAFYHHGVQIYFGKYFITQKQN